MAALKRKEKRRLLFVMQTTLNLFGLEVKLCRLYVAASRPSINIRNLINLDQISMLTSLRPPDTSSS